MQRVLMVCVIGCMVLAGAPLLFCAEPIAISAHELHRAAAENTRAAEAQYLGKNVVVRGIVVSRGMSRYLTPTVVLSSHAGGPELVICVLPRLDVAKLSDYEPGQTAVFSARVHRLSPERVVLKESKAMDR